MKEKVAIGISLMVGFAAAVFFSSYIKGEDPGQEALRIAFYCVAYILLTKALKLFLKRKEMAKGTEKNVLTVLAVLGHACVVGIFVLCVWAGTSYARQGEIKGAVVLLLTAGLLAVSEGIKLKKILCI